MADVVGRSLWVGRSIYFGVACLIIFGRLLPLDQRPTLFSPPDLLIVLTFVWVVRRPDYAPIVIIGVLFFLADLLFQKPPGLFAGLVLIASEIVRSQAKATRDITLPGEFGLIASAILTVSLLNWAVLALTLTPQASQAQTILHILATIVAIPFVMVAAQFIFGVRHITPGQFETSRSRL